MAKDPETNVTGEERQDDSSSDSPTCCLFFPVTCGAVILSFLALILSGFPIAAGMMLLKNPAYYATVLPELKYDQHMVKLYAGSMLGLGSMLFLFSLMALIGIAKRRAGLLVPLLLIGVFSCVLSFFVVLDCLNPTVTHELYRHYHHRSNVFCFSLLLFLVKLYFTLTIYQSYQQLSTQRRPQVMARSLPVDAGKLRPVVPPLSDFPPAYA